MEFLDRLSAALPDSVTINVNSAAFSFSPNGSEEGNPTPYDVTIEDDGVFQGTWDAWCIDVNQGIEFGFSGINEGADNATYSAKVYSSYEALPGDILQDSEGVGLANPNGLSAVNYLINNFAAGTEVPGFGTANRNDLQSAIWTLLGEDPSIGDLVGDEVPDPDRVSAMVQAALDNPNYVPSFGESVAVILVPQGLEGTDTTEGDRPSSQMLVAAVPIAQLGDKVFLDDDADGIQDAGEAGVSGVTVNLLADVDGDGTIEDGEVIDSVTTDANGNYGFDVVPGEYKVQFVEPEGFDFTDKDAGSDDAADSDADETTDGITDVITMEPGESDPTIDAGLVVEPVEPASLGDTVFFDDDGDGIQDAGEDGVAGVTVSLTGGGANGIIGDGD
ncbi:MAG: SdrD B-like domain-containing protein, partial [Geitlerinemataceae cyanobacterium]